MRHRVAAEGGDNPTARLARIGERLNRGERLGAHHHQSCRRIKVGEVRGDVRAVDVADESATQPWLRKRLGGEIRHCRPEVAASDPDVDDGCDLLPGCTNPITTTHAVGESGHSIKHGVDIGDDIDSVDHQATGTRGTQGRVQHGAILSGVDVRPGKHRVASGFHLRRHRDLLQRGQHAVVDQVLRVVDT